jgi:hypothetical protein
MGGGYVPNSGRPSYSFSSLVPVRHWARDPALRSWPVLLLIALVCVPPIALVMLNNPTEAKIHDIAWIFAVYFAVAWLLLLGVIVRPQHVTRSMLAAIAVIGIITQAPGPRSAPGPARSRRRCSRPTPRPRDRMSRHRTRAHHRTPHRRLPPLRPLRCSPPWSSRSRPASHGGSSSAGP